MVHHFLNKVLSDYLKSNYKDNVFIRKITFYNLFLIQLCTIIIYRVYNTLKSLICKYLFMLRYKQIYIYKYNKTMEKTKK